MVGDGDVNFDDLDESQQQLVHDFDTRRLKKHWSRPSSRKLPSSGLIEVLGVTGSLHLAQIKSGLASPYKIAQIDCNPRPSTSTSTGAGAGVVIEIATSKPLPMQMDGEPWVEAPASLSLRLVARKAAVLVCREVEVELPAPGDAAAGGEEDCGPGLAQRLLDEGADAEEEEEEDYEPNFFFGGDGEDSEEEESEEEEEEE